MHRLFGTLRSREYILLDTIVPDSTDIEMYVSIGKFYRAILKQCLTNS